VSGQGLRRGCVVLAALAAGCAAWAMAACGGGGDPKLIVYEGSSNKATNVYTVDPDSGATVQLTHVEGFAGHPGWSPDRKQIIFVSNMDGHNANDVYVMDADGSDVRRLTDTPSAGEISPRFSPDGKQVAYARQDDNRWALWVMQADGSGQQKITADYSFVEFPSWTHDASEIYFSAIERDEATGDSYGSAKIFSADVASHAVRLRIDTGTGDVCPHFSRDGKRLTYAAGPPGGEAGNIDIYAHDMASDDVSGAKDTALTSAAGKDDYGNASPDDRTMVFLSDRDGNPELYVMDRDGSHQRRLTNTPDVQENVPDW
jgi:TolB protein